MISYNQIQKALFNYNIVYYHFTYQDFSGAFLLLLFVVPVFNATVPLANNNQITNKTKRINNEKPQLKKTICINAHLGFQNNNFYPLMKINF